tara:strand:+ start:60 stop:650 length:591 start_codon:yes stop_codon:yes gene_type:complete
MSQSDLKNIEEFIVDDVKSNLDDSDNNEITGLDDEPKSDMIKIISNDGYVCCIERKYTLISEFLKGMYCGDMDAGKEGSEITLTKLSGDNLKYIEEYMNHHKGDDNDIPNMPLEDTDMKKVLKDPWDAEFMERIVPISENLQQVPNLRKLIDLLTDSNYLGMNVMLHKLSAKFASFLRNKDEEEISKFLATYNTDV